EMSTMNEDTHSDENDEPEEPAQAADGEAEPEAAPEGAEAEIADLRDKLLRAVAETENLRRRAEREREDAAKYGIANFARDLLSVADNMQRALDAVPDEELDKAGEATKGLVMGVRMTEKELMACFERHGVKRISPAGEKFDPNIHQAIAEVPGSGEPAGVVVDVAQPGFVISDRVLRAAMVTVSSGAGASDAASPDQDASPGGNIDTTA
ncbi:MAG: nucleotide exchange factor GrpE, partial [Pseudomonadota bacterium]